MINAKRVILACLAFIPLSLMHWLGMLLMGKKISLAKAFSITWHELME